ncbi:hypothetical protein PHYBOEH_006940 [Phytophthora boehmeriae]|uniref:Chitin-binding type-4 domain-containing protein n=1 Tax=Phytophthora boehmeriae TaxID=109152 RepID=A0A8T1W9N9_9STRA|nr:hypothetical protein PHYBOEH_006940 [Phytophthora boehmeriae]
MPSIALFTLVLLSSTTLLFSGVEGHGMMLFPLYRPISDQYLKDSGVLINIGGGQVQIAPLEGLAQHKQADYPIAPTFDLMNGCRGTVYEEGNNVTTLQPGDDFDVKWNIAAPHPGYMKLSVVKPSEESGKIMYENYKTVLTIEPFGEHGGDGSSKATMPDDIDGCEKPGDCVLQFYWHSDIADQTYVTCADIIVPGSGGTSTTPSAPTATNSATKATPTPTTPKPTTAAPKAAKKSITYESEASVAGEADSPSKCSRRMRH